MALAVAVTTSAQAISSPLLTLHPSPGRSFGLLDRVRPRPPRACATATAADIQRHGILGPGAKEISAAERAAQHRYVQSLAVGLILERLFSLLGRIWSAIWLTWLATDTTVGTLSARYRLPPPLSGRYQIDLSRCRADIPEAVGLIPPTTSHCRPDTGSSPIDLGHYPADTVDFISSIEALSGRHDFLLTPLSGRCRPAIGYPPRCRADTRSTSLAVGPIATRYGPCPAPDIDQTIGWITDCHGCYPTDSGGGNRQRADSGRIRSRGKFQMMIYS
jgi:hypothetical protein